MKNYQQTIINVLIVVALCVIAWVLVTNPKSNAKETQPQPVVAAPVVAPEPVVEDPGPVPIPLQELSAMAKPVAPKAKVYDLGPCAQNTYSMNCQNSKSPSIYLGYQWDDSGDFINGLFILPGVQSKGLIKEVKFHHITNKDRCEVATWGPDGETLTKEGINVLLMPCDLNSFDYIDVVMENKTFRIPN